MSLYYWEKKKWFPIIFKLKSKFLTKLKFTSESYHFSLMSFSCTNMYVYELYNTYIHLHTHIHIKQLQVRLYICLYIYTHRIYIDIGLYLYIKYIYNLYPSLFFGFILFVQYSLVGHYFFEKVIFPSLNNRISHLIHYSPVSNPYQRAHCIISYIFIYIFNPILFSVVQ